MAIWIQTLERNAMPALGSTPISHIDRRGALQVLTPILKELKPPTFLRECGKVALHCAPEGLDHPDYLLKLSDLELIDRHNRMVGRKIKSARFP